MEFPKDSAWHSPKGPFREVLEEGLCHPCSASSPSSLGELTPSAERRSLLPALRPQ